MTQMMDRVQLDYLRRYRDEILAHSSFGRFIISAYNTLSRWLYPAVSKRKLLQGIVHKIFASPAATFARNRVNKKVYKKYNKDRVLKRIISRMLQAQMNKQKE